MTRRAIVSILLVAGAITLAVLPLPKYWIERVYSLGLYPAIQSRLTPLTNLVPVALFDLSIVLLIAWLGWRFERRWRNAGFARAIASTLGSALVAAAVIYLAFLLLWGFNYRRVPLEEKIAFDSSGITAEAARELATETAARLNGLHAAAHQRIAPTADTLALAFAAARDRLGHRVIIAPGRPKRSLLERYFRWSAIDGMTVPWFLEIIVNPDVLAVERPFVIAHEWAHLAGFADEDEANYIAWLTCVTGDELMQYSGWLAIYGHVVNGLPRADQRAINETLTEGPRRDFADIVRRLQRSQPAVRAVARESYDAYLRANRVEGGIESYDRVVRLILGAWAGKLKAAGADNSR
jgi:hypothetical protein